jgi:CRISPR/Cas system-associated endonuclease Cas3-HD
MGGDKEVAKCKEAESDEVTAFKDALKDLVTAVSIVHSLGKVLEDFEQ